MSSQRTQLSFANRDKVIQNPKPLKIHCLLYLMIFLGPRFKYMGSDLDDQDMCTEANKTWYGLLDTALALMSTHWSLTYKCILY